MDGLAYPEPDMIRQVVPCFGLWEYTHTNEDNVMQYRLAGITEDEEVARQWHNGQTTEIYKVTEASSLPKSKM